MSNLPVVKTEASHVTIQNALDCFAVRTEVHTKAALALIASGSVAFIIAAYLQPADKKMDIKDVVETMKKACLVRGMKRSNTFRYIDLAKKTALKIFKDFSFGGITLDIADSQTADIATQHVVDYLDKCKVPGFPDVGVRNVDRLEIWLTGKSLNQQARIKAANKNKNEAAKAALQAMAASDDDEGKAEKPSAIVPRVLKTLDNYNDISTNAGEVTPFIAAAAVKSVLNTADIPGLIDLIVTKAHRNPFDLMSAIAMTMSDTRALDKMVKMISGRIKELKDAKAGASEKVSQAA